MFIFLESDSFEAQFKKKSEEENLLGGIGGSTSPQSVRRPYRGIQIKEDTYATLSVVKSNGEVIPLTSSSARVDTRSDKNKKRGLVDEYSDFIIQSINDQRVEKQQIIETFGQPYIYFFGERPRMITFSGLLINTEDFNWRSQFWYNYENQLRGTKLVQANARVYLAFDTILVEGYPLQATATDTADSPYSIPFQMQMFVTNYYDFSNIGQTRFPGAGEHEDIEVLNQELAESRNKFVSTGAAVRAKNLERRGAGGILADLRAGIQGINNLKTIAGGFLQTASQVLGGRTVRVPIGVAGFLANTGEGTLATGSISTANRPNFDARTSSLSSVTGPLKIRVPTAAQFAPSWVSAVDDSPRGYIWENIDEYPNRNQPKTLTTLAGGSKSRAALLEAEARAKLRVLNTNAFNTQLEAKAFELTQDGGALQDLTERVSFAKSNFGMVMNAKAFIQDPVSVGKRLVGINPARNPIEELAKRGVKIFPGGNIQQVQSFIGSQALQTFRGTADSLAGGVDEVATGLGAAYDQGVYQAGAGPDNAYENVFGDRDFSVLVEADPSTSSALTEAFGDSDAAPDGSEIDPSSFSQVFGAGTSSPATPSAGEKALLASLNQTGIAPDADIDTSGIRSVGDDDAPIDPVV